MIDAGQQTSEILDRAPRPNLDAETVSTALVKPTGKPRALATLARRINEAHENCLKRLRHGLQHEIKAGEALLEAKGQLKYGEFVPWIEANCNFSKSTAYIYMAKAKALPLLGIDFQDIGKLPPRRVIPSAGWLEERDGTRLPQQR